MTVESCSYSRLIEERFQQTVVAPETERSVFHSEYKEMISDRGKTRHSRRRVVKASEILKIKERTVANMEFINRVFVDVFSRHNKKP